jgi:hypothetical protein
VRRECSDQASDQIRDCVPLTAATVSTRQLVRRMARQWHGDRGLLVGGTTPKIMAPAWCWARRHPGCQLFLRIYREEVALVSPIDTDRIGSQENTNADSAGLMPSAETRTSYRWRYLRRSSTVSASSPGLRIW